MKHIFVVSILFVGLFSTSALSSERSVADELLELEKYRYNESEDISNDHYRSGNMNRKLLHLIWEIAKEVRGNKANALLELEKYRYDESDDISNGYYRSGNMNRKMLHLVWEILVEAKMNKETQMTRCPDTTASGRGGDGI